MTPRPVGLRFEQRDQSLGIGTSTPRISWHLDETSPDWRQSNYEIECELNGQVLTSGPVESDQSVLVPWPFRPLRSREQASVRVRVNGSDASSRSEWSDRVVAEAGLLEASDWVAQPITNPSARSEQVARFRREFTLDESVVAARLYVSALGVYEVEINGTPIGTEVLAPGWTVYSHRLRYATHDVASVLRSGDNALGVTVAEGWYSGRIGFRGGVRNLYGDRTAAIAQLEVEYADGRRDVIATDTSWRCAQGPVTSASLYDGETYDARLRDSAWSTPDYDESDWSSVELLDPVADRLIAPTGPPISRHEEFRPVKIWESPSGVTLVDFGQNIAGRIRLRVDGPAGTRIDIRHAEVLENGELGIRPLRHAAAHDVYILSGNGHEEYEPSFTIHGFRYAGVTGWPGQLTADHLVAVACYSSIGTAGTFECSHSELNQLHRNVVWSMKGNFVDIPTDCPQRDERLGWTGDIQVFTPTAAFLADCAGFLASWLDDLAAEQQQLGTVPPYVPWVELVFPAVGAAAWSDAAVIVPCTLYEHYGDLELLERHYPSMKAWVDETTSMTSPSGLWDRGFQFGDWLDPAAPPDDPSAARTEAALVATAYRAHSLRLLTKAAEALGRDDDVAAYKALVEQVVAAFNHEFVTPSGRLSSDAQTAYALALRFDLLPTVEQRERAGRRLRELVAADDYCIGTGFVGTPLVCDALADTGHIEDAYYLLLQTKCPSWLYPVSMGATTIWERWDSMLADGSINPGEMTSFNHYALGAVADFLHRRVAGLAPAAPGYRHMHIEPMPGGGLVRASATHQTPYGEAAVSWTRINDRLILDVVVPPSTTATVRLPGAKAIEVGAGAHHFDHPFRPVEQDGTEPPVQARFVAPPEPIAQSS